MEKGYKKSKKVETVSSKGMYISQFTEEQLELIRKLLGQYVKNEKYDRHKLM